MGDIDASLDDLIKQRKAQRPKSGRGGRGRGAARGAARGAVKGRGAARGRGRGRGAGGNASKPLTITIKGRGRGGGGVKPRAQSRPQKQGGGQMPAGRWLNDKFSGPRGDLRSTMRGNQPQAAAAPTRNIPKGGLTTGTKVIVTNLETGVTEQDMKDLFETVGPLKSVKMTAAGVSEVVFRKSNDAAKAFKQYNHVVLDGRPMYITVSSPAIQAAGAPKAAPQRKARGNGNVNFSVTL